MKTTRKQILDTEIAKLSMTIDMRDLINPVKREGWKFSGPVGRQLEKGGAEKGRRRTRNRNAWPSRLCRGHSSLKIASVDSYPLRSGCRAQHELDGAVMALCASM